MLDKDLLKSVLREQKEDFLSKDVGVRRSILGDIKKHVKIPHVVVLTGLRRVGKSTLLLQIAKEYLREDFFFVNFEDERLLNFKVEDFDFLHETLISIYGECKIFLMDEIQNIPHWEKFVRRMHDKGYKFFLTGSNASLLSQELGTRLTGRSVHITLLPFSFEEFLHFKGYDIPNLTNLTTQERGNLRKLCAEYMLKGGIPDSLKFPKVDIHKSLYNDVLYRDIATRYNVENTKKLKELAYYLVTNFASLISFNKLKNILKIGSATTISKYVSYLENSWLFFTVNKHAYSLKEQEIAPKKNYCIDTGLINSVSFSFSKNTGRLMENMVFLHLKKFYEDIYYYKTKTAAEIDFFIPEKNLFIQVCENLQNEGTSERELSSFGEITADVKNFIVVTENERRVLSRDGFRVKLIPLYEFLLKKF